MMKGKLEHHLFTYG